MSETEEAAAEHKPGHAPARHEPEADSAARESWHKRLKNRLASGLARVLAAIIARLQATRTRLGAEDEESEERPRGKPHAPPAKETVASATVSEAGPAKPHKLRNALIMLSLILVAAGAGAGAAYSLLSRLLKDQSLAIDSHEQEIRTFQLEEQEMGKKLAEALRQLEAEQKLRTDMEMRLVEAEQKRVAVEAGTKPLAAEAPKAEPSTKAQPPVQKEAETEPKLVGRPSKASSFKPPATANCSLAGSDPAALRRCIDEYNRK